MRIKLKRNPTYTDMENDISFIDVATDESIGKIEFDVNKRLKSAYIDYTYIYPEYRGKGILKKHMRDILCDMKCNGANVVHLDTITNDAKKVWEHLGFKVKFEHLESGVLKTRMEKNISDMICRCEKKR